MPEHLEIRAGVKVTGDSVKEILDEATRVAEAALAVQPPLSKAEEAAIRRIQNATLTLYNILTDATVDEAKRERGKNGSKRLRAGYVDIIPIGTRKYKRGGKAIWPPNNVLRVKKTADLTERSLQKLRLRGVDTFEGRKYVFDFIYGWLIVHPLTHTLPQLYSREQFLKGIWPVHKSLRFKLPLCLDLGSHYLAFTSMDAMCEVEWKPRKEMLTFDKGLWGFTNNPKKLDPRNYIDGKIDKYLEELVALLKASSSKGHLAFIIWLRRQGHLFPGVGVYTASEISFLAGLWGAWELEEFLRCPSRVARLLLAYITWIETADSKIEKVFSECALYGYVVAANEDQRMSYTELVKVFGKEHARVHTRMGSLYKTLLKAIAVEDKETWVDLFEPLYCKAALDLVLTPGGRYSFLGPLIFGLKEWRCHSNNPQAQYGTDPLTLYFKDEGLLAEPEITHLPSYDTLYPAPDPPRRHSKLFTSLWTLEKEYWTVYPSTIPTVFSDHLEPKEVRERRQLANIIKETYEHRIGPTDYQGVAIRLYGSGGLP